MQGIEDLLQQWLEKSKIEIQNRTAWFYAYFLSADQEETMITAASTILFPRDYAVLLSPNGKREAAALKRSSLLKKDYLRAQLRDIVESYADSLRMHDDEIPEAIRQKLNDRLDKFAMETSRALSQEVQRSFLQDYPVKKTAKNLTAIFDKAAASVNGYAVHCCRQAGWIRVAQSFQEQGQTVFTFVAEAGENTCGRCSELDGTQYTFVELSKEGLFPPLHPHCRCALIPVGGTSYVMEENNRQAPWYEAYLNNLAGIPSDAVRMFEGFLQKKKNRFDDGNYLDWLSMGIVSGFWKGVENRTQTMLDAPNAYNIANWLTIGLLDLGKGAIIPDKPLSLEHWLDSLGFASALAGMSETAKQAIYLHGTAPSVRIPSQQAPFPGDGKGGIRSTGSGSWEAQTQRTGEEWYSYYNETFGSEYVIWKPNSLEDIIQNPRRLYGATPTEIANMLGEGWKYGKYGITGTGWKFVKGDKMVFYHFGGKHGGSYYGFSTGSTRKVKIVGSDYIPLPSDKATVIYFKEDN